MAEVIYHATLENKVNTIALVKKNSVGEPENFASHTGLYIKHVASGSYVASGIGSTTGNIFGAEVDLSNVTVDVNQDYENPKYEYSYAVRTPVSGESDYVNEQEHKVYLTGQLNIIDIA